MSRIAGTSLLGNFDQIVAKYTETSRRLDGNIALVEREIALANQGREQAYTELSSYYCEEREMFAANLSSISRNLQEIFDQKATRRHAIEADIERSQKLIEQNNTDLSHAQAERDVAANEMAQAGVRVDANLAQNQEFLGTKQEFQEASDQLRADISATEILKQEAAAKLKDYQGDRCFTYLLKSKYSTSEYSRGGLAAAGDRWIAAKLNWPTNFRNYSILAELPDFADKRLNASKREVDLLNARLALRLHEVEHSEGLEEARLKHGRRCQTVTEIQERLKLSQAQLTVLLEERKALEANNDPFVQKAKLAVKTMLTSESVASLRARVAKTATERDDKLVTLIEQAEKTINEGRLSIKSLRQEREITEQSCQRARQARTRFSNDYTGSYDRFDNGIQLDQILLGFIAGKMSENHFWSQVDTNHHDETPVRTYHSSSSASSWDFGSSSSDGGGGGSSFGGGDSGGGGGSFGGGD